MNVITATAPQAPVEQAQPTAASRRRRSIPAILLTLAAVLGLVLVGPVGTASAAGTATAKVCFKYGSTGTAWTEYHNVQYYDGAYWQNALAGPERQRVRDLEPSGLAVPAAVPSQLPHRRRPPVDRHLDRGDGRCGPGVPLRHRVRVLVTRLPGGASGPVRDVPHRPRGYVRSIGVSTPWTSASASIPPRPAAEPRRP